MLLGGRAAFMVLACQLQVALAQAQPRETGREWVTYRNERYGFSLRYPADIFEVERTSDAADGQVFVSRESDARLLVGVLPNTNRQSPASYQDQIARQSYGDFAITFRRVSGSWFVLSGEGNGKTFYEKVIFSCNGRVINSFAMIYPSERGEVFDRVVEGIEKSFRPGTDCGRDVGSATPQRHSSHQGAERSATYNRRDRHSALADRIARSRGKDVVVVLRRRGPPYDYKVVRGYAQR
jgi:hypothetical protein